MLIFLVLIQMAFAQSPAQPLEGQWLQVCRNYSSRSELFVADQVTLVESYFQDAACTQPLLSFYSQGTHSEAGQNMDFRFSEVSIVLYTEPVRKDFNDRRVCGFSDWKLAEKKVITGLDCELFAERSPSPIPQKNEMRFGIYKLEGDHLFFGQLNQEKNALTPEARPTDWDPRFYIRQ